MLVSMILIKRGILGGYTFYYLSREYIDTAYVFFYKLVESENARNLLKRFEALLADLGV
jgi:hypothetical protein